MAERLNISTNAGTSSGASRKVARQTLSCQIDSTTRPLRGWPEMRSVRPATSRPTMTSPWLGSGEMVTAS